MEHSQTNPTLDEVQLRTRHVQRLASEQRKLTRDSITARSPQRATILTQVQANDALLRALMYQCEHGNWYVKGVPCQCK
jgi:hypothetical protein